MLSSAVLLLAVSAAAQTSSAPRLAQAPTVEIRVTDRSGTPIESARVTLEPERLAMTNAAGRVMFRNVKPGDYLARVERPGFVPLDKEFTVAPGRSTVFVVAALSPARAVAASGDSPRLPGAWSDSARDPRALSIPEFLERQYIGQQPIKESPLGCAGATEARLIQLRDPLISHAHGEADETLYVIAGEGVLKIGDQPQKVAAGWFSIIPRGTTHSLVRQGRNPLIVLSVMGGHPCLAAVARAGTR
jgi:mannose-6-phosphate isomerase-like protein (cupin superfamily)